MGPLICRVPSIERCVSKSVSVCDSLRFDENERSRKLSQNDDKNQNLVRIRWEHGNQASLSLMGSLRQAMLALRVIFLIDQRVITCHMFLPDSKFATNYIPLTNCLKQQMYLAYLPYLQMFLKKLSG